MIKSSVLRFLFVMFHHHRGPDGTEGSLYDRKHMNQRDGAGIDPDFLIRAVAVQRHFINGLKNRCDPHGYDKRKGIAVQLFPVYGVLLPDFLETPKLSLRPDADHSNHSIADCGCSSQDEQLLRLEQKAARYGDTRKQKLRHDL